MGRVGDFVIGDLVNLTQDNHQDGKIIFISLANLYVSVSGSVILKSATSANAPLISAT
jgi:hypothetical protein